MAATRAEKNLFLLKPNTDRGGRGLGRGRYVSFTETTRFLRELSGFEKLTDTWTIRLPEAKTRRRKKSASQRKGPPPPDEVLKKINAHFSKE